MFRRNESLRAPVTAAFLAHICACNTTYDDPHIWRAAPRASSVFPGEIERTEVRGCVFDESMDVIDNAVGFIIVVNAEVASESDGVAQMAMTYEMTGDEYDEDGTNVDRASVLRGATATLTEDHVFLELPILLSAAGRSDACSDWKYVEFSWSDVSGAAPLAVDWEVGFRVEVEQAAQLGIDFRPSG